MLHIRKLSADDRLEVIQRERISITVRKYIYNSKHVLRRCTQLMKVTGLT